jgi:hypothetical protein
MQCAVGSVLVEVRHVLGQNMFEVAAVEDQYPVEQLAAYGARSSVRRSRSREVLAPVCAECGCSRW